MLRRSALILSGLIISLILVDIVNSADTLMVYPHSLSLTIPSGRLDTSYIEVTNLGDSSILVRSYFDPNWMLVFPSEFELSDGEGRRVLAIFFIRRGEEPGREGEIVFKTEDNEKQVKVDVYISSPLGRREKKVERNDEPNQEIEEEVKRLREEIGYLREKIRERELQIATLSKPPREKRIEELKPLYEYLSENLRGEIEKGEVQLAWLEDKLSLTIIGPIAFDPAKIHIKRKGLMEILERIGIVLREKTDLHKRIGVKGYTIESRLIDKFLSNWELLADQANNGKIRIIISSLSEEGQKEEVR